MPKISTKKLKLDNKSIKEKYDIDTSLLLEAFIEMLVEELKPMLGDEFISEVVRIEIKNKKDFKTTLYFYFFNFLKQYYPNLIRRKKLSLTEIAKIYLILSSLTLQISIPTLSQKAEQVLKDVLENPIKLN